MSEKSLYLEEDHVFEFREKRDLIKLLNLKVITYLPLPFVSYTEQSFSYPYNQTQKVALSCRLKPNLPEKNAKKCFKITKKF